MENEANGEKLRRQDLERLTRHYLTEASRLGYGPDHVLAVFEKKLARWQTAGEPPNPEDDT
jgi:hypothetical protein